MGKFDASEVYPLLWQGAVPPEGTALSSMGFDAVVLCAREHQPGKHRFLGVDVIHAPNADDFSRLPSRDELKIAVHAARKVAAVLAQGGKVLVTCRMGRNRSGLVSALALHILTGQDGFTCMRQVKKRRRKSLGNPGFQEVLANLKGKKKAPSSEPVQSPHTTLP